MGRWTANTRVAGDPDDVLMVLTEPEAIARWARVPFEVVDWDGERLRAGEHVRVRGALAGRAVEFEVEVVEADDGRLALTAIGPIRLDVEYLATELDCGSEVRATVTVTGRGLIGRILAQATDALLASGALRAAVSRMAVELELDRELAMAA
jgi:hypothetical protein